MRVPSPVKSPVYADWLSQIKEDVLEPELPICDPHHHLWDYPGSRYLLGELLEDTGSGHKVVSTVFVECGAMYRSERQEPYPDLRPIGETEFVNGVAAMSASGGFGVHRCMFESNFPVDKRSCSYHVLWNAFKMLASGFSPHEKAALFHDTASRVYRLL